MIEAPFPELSYAVTVAVICSPWSVGMKPQSGKNAPAGKKSPGSVAGQKPDSGHCNTNRLTGWSLSTSVVAEHY